MNSRNPPLPYYFAYGSNLHEEDWHQFCRKKGLPLGLLRAISPAYLPDHSLIFNHYSSSRHGELVELHGWPGALEAWDPLMEFFGYDAINRLSRRTLVQVEVEEACPPIA